MNIPGYSTNGLKMMQDGLRKALADDDALPTGQDKLYGVREFPDWREQSNKIEAELDSRGAIYTKVAW
jgi:hypothetical protein